MLIGELARRTSTTTRQLRYYERVGLVAAERMANGYRDYSEDAVALIDRISALLAAGLPTKDISGLLPCTKRDGAVDACPGVVDRLRTRLRELDRRAAELDRVRDSLRSAIAGAQRSSVTDRDRG